MLVAQLAALEAEAAARRTRRRVVGVGSQLCLVDVPRVSRARAERARPRARALPRLAQGAASCFCKPRGIA